MARRDGSDLARVLIDRAAGDALAVRRLAADAEMPDHVVGFHAQQAVEKLLKAVLSDHGVSYGRTHDLGLLVELVESSGLPAPPQADELEVLTPWATALRYGEDPADPGPLDRPAALELISRVSEWARQALS